MKTSGKVGIAILFALSLLGFLARAEIADALHTKNDENSNQNIILSNSVTSIAFNDVNEIPDIAIPAYYMGSVAPINKRSDLKFIEAISTYLKLHNEKVLKITGAYVPNESEIKIGGYENIGLARAAYISNELIKTGIAVPRLLISSQLINDQNKPIALSFELFNDSENIP